MSLPVKDLIILIDEYAISVKELDYRQYLGMSSSVEASSDEKKENTRDKTQSSDVSSQNEQSNQDVSTLEQSISKESLSQADSISIIIDIFLQRDIIQNKIKESKLSLNGQALEKLIDADNMLYAFIQEVRKKKQSEIHTWRSYYPNVPQENWWWYADDYIYRSSDGIVHEPSLSVWLIIGIIFTVISIVFATYTAQGLISRQLNVEAALSVVANVLWGGVLATPTGLSLVRGVVRMTLSDGDKILKRIINFFRFSQHSENNENSLQRRTIPAALSEGNFTFFAFSTFLLLFSISFPVIILPATSNFFFQQGQRAFEQADYSAALDLFTLSARLQPTLLPGITQPDAAAQLTQLGTLYVEIGDEAQAIVAYERALEKDSRIIVAQVALADLYANSGEFDRAISLSTQSIEISRLFLDGVITLPSNRDTVEIMLVRSHIIRGRILLNQGHLDAAIANFEEAENLPAFDVEGEVFYTASLYRLRAFARLSELGEINEDYCEVANNIKDDVINAFRAIASQPTAPPYDVWESDMQEINSWLNAFDCSQPYGSTTTWPTRDSY